MDKLTVCALLVCLTGGTANGQTSAFGPPASLGATDIYAEFRLPPLKDWPDGPLAAAASLNVVKRARVLGINADTATSAWSEAQRQFAASEAFVAPVENRWRSFAGTRVSELNRFLERTPWARVSSVTLDADEPIRISQSGVALDLGSARITTGMSLPYLVRIEHCADVTLTGGDFEGGDSAILISKGDSVTVRNTHIHALSGEGIVVTQSNRTVISQNRIEEIGGSGILLHGNTASTLIERNEITRGRGSSNMDAAIVVSDRNVDLAARGDALLGPDHYWVITQVMLQRVNPPRNNLIVMNHLARNASSAVYVDGAVGTVIARNVIEGNAKEGICLDNGATANVVVWNDILQNGQRWGESDQVMEKDSIQGAGRLPDGTPADKVPGISIDNAIYNIVFSNNVAENFGGGIKIVRTGYFNAIGLNTIRSNNEGASAKVHFFGIELGSAPLDGASGDLDAAPSRGNIMFSNLIRGNHYAGIFFAMGSDTNDVFDNVIMDCSNWALEAVAAMPNSSLNNLTNRPSRNMEAGISASLVQKAVP